MKHLRRTPSLRFGWHSNVVQMVFSDTSETRSVVKDLSEDSKGTPADNGLQAEFGVSAVPLHSARHPGLRVGGLERESEAHSLAQNGIVLITQGSGKCIIDTEFHTVGPDSVLFLRPNQRVLLEGAGDLCGFEVLFSEGILTLNDIHARQLPGADLFEGKICPPIHTLTPQAAQGALKLIQDIKTEFDLRHPAYVTALRSFLIVLLLHFWRSLGLSKPANDEGRLYTNNVSQRYEKMVAEEPRLDRTVTHYAKQLEVSASHLHELVKEKTGLTPIAVIQREVILEAKRLLIHTDLQVAEIAEKLVFKDASYFGRYFRRNVESTPGEYRRMSRQSLGLALH